MLLRNEVEKWQIVLPLCIEGFPSSNPHVDVAGGGAVKAEVVICVFVIRSVKVSTRGGGVRGEVVWSFVVTLKLKLKLSIIINNKLKRCHIKEVSLHSNILEEIILRKNSGRVENF